MSVYTIQLRNLIENDYKIFDFDYPIFDENYRKVLEQKIIDRYYFREIGFETPAQFKHFLKTRLNEIMPYYNQLYESENLDFNPLINVDVTETHAKTIDQTSNYNQADTSNQTNEVSGSSTITGTGTNTSTQTEKQVFQDTPQSRLGDVNYATNITDDTNNSSGSSTNNTDTEASNTSTAAAQGSSESETIANTMESYETKRRGSEGMRYPASVLMEWRKSFLNIDVQILDNLNDLFMGVY